MRGGRENAGGWTLLGAPLDCSGGSRGEARAPSALRAAGLASGPLARDAGDLPVTLSSSERDPVTGMIAFSQLRATAAVLRQRVGEVLREGHRPFIVGGDCTILIGTAAALRDTTGRFGLAFVDGHADYLDGLTSPTGEAADMDLAILNGHGPAGLVDLAGRAPLVEPRDVALLGHRSPDGNAAVAEERGYVPEAVLQWDAPALLQAGPERTGVDVEQRLRAQAGRFWLHLDLDVLDEAALPAVTYPQRAGPGWEELTALLRPLAASPALLGITLADFNPDRDRDGRHARRVVALVAEVLGPGGGTP